jgi:nicotinate-nucleotide adenylyltransferase
VFGGSFDPFHRAHRAICEAALKIASRVLVVVSANPPHKEGSREMTPFHHRVAMARLGVEGLARTEVLELEGRRAGPSFTVDTLEALRKTFPPGTRFKLILGADMLQDFPLWHDWEGILERASLLVAQRPGYEVDPPPEFEGRNAPIEGLEIPAIDVSSTDVRRRIEADEDLGERVSPAVRAYLQDHALYRGAEAPEPEGEAPAPAS